MASAGFTAAAAVHIATGRRAVEIGVEFIELDDARSMVEIFDEVAGTPNSCFLDSSLQMERFGHHSFIAFDPYLVLTTRALSASFARRGESVTKQEMDRGRRPEMGAR